MMISRKRTKKELSSCLYLNFPNRQYKDLAPTKFGKFYPTSIMKGLLCSIEQVCSATAADHHQ